MSIRRMWTRLLIIIACAFVFPVLLAWGQGGTMEPIKESTASRTTGQFDPPKPWILRDSAMSNMTSFDPVKVVDAFSVDILANVYEGLVNVSAEGRPVPGLAESWQHSDDGRTWIFHLRKGVKFHPLTGCDFKVPEEVTAKDVVYSFKRTLSAPGSVTSWIFTDILEGAAEFAAGKTKEIKGLEIIDDHTLKIRLTKPFFLVSKLTFNGTWIYPAGIVEACGKEFLSSHEIGTGPYSIKEFIPDDRIVLTRFDSYRTEHHQAPETVVVRIFSDPLAAMESFARGELDIVEAGISTLPRARKLVSQGNRMVSVKGNYLDYICMNDQAPPFDDIRVRRALNMAVNREVLAGLLGDFGVPAYGYIPPFSPAYRGTARIKKEGFRFDPAGAKALLTEYLAEKNLSSLDLELVIDSGEVPETIGQFVTAQIEKELPGVKISLKKITFPAMLQMAFSGKGKFFRIWWNIVTPGEFMYFLFYFPGQDPPGGFNLSFYDSKIFLQKYAAVMGTLDDEKRRQGAQQLEDILIRDAAAIPLLHKTYHFLERKGIMCPINGLLRKPYIFSTQKDG